MIEKVHIIIVTYNGMPWLDSCLKSCNNYPVVVVDNASTDNTVSFIETHYPHVTLIRQTDNLGFGQANNKGIRYALDLGAEHLLLLNQDAYLVDGFLEDLLAFQKQNPAYGILSPIHITAERNKLDSNFLNYMLREQTGQFYSDFVLGNTLALVYEVPFVNAAAWLVSKECLATVGGFDPLFFHYGEDDNYCQRVSYHGFKIGVLPHTYVVHDREDRKQNKAPMFSPDYYKHAKRKYQVVFGNINIDNPIDLKIKKLQKSIVKLQLQLKLDRAASVKKELTLLLDLKPEIAKSRILNSKPGLHYL